MHSANPSGRQDANTYSVSAAYVCIHIYVYVCLYAVCILQTPQRDTMQTPTQLQCKHRNSEPYDLEPMGKLQSHDDRDKKWV